MNAEAIHDTMPQLPYAVTVTETGVGRSGEWGLVSPASAGASAKCSQAGDNPALPLDQCKKKCEATKGCNTLNFRAPTGCIVKTCTPAGEPLTTADGGFDVWCLGCANTTALEWRLSRHADTVYATLLLDSDTLPNHASLSLPFVIDVGTPHPKLTCLALGLSSHATAGPGRRRRQLAARQTPERLPSRRWRCVVSVERREGPRAERQGGKQGGRAIRSCV